MNRADDGRITGLKDEMSKFHKDNADSFLKDFKNNVKSRIGGEFYPFIDYHFINLF